MVNVRTKEKEGYWGLQVGGVNHSKPKNVSPRQKAIRDIFIPIEC